MSRYNSAAAHVNSTEVMAYTKLGHAQAKLTPSMESGGRHEVSLLAKELLATGSC